ncbi:MAG: glycoside hydrolase family 15 protein, partial [Acidimicrobiales bacterium]
YSGHGGRVRVIDSLNTGTAGRLPWNELARRVECLEGNVALAWELVPGNRFGMAKPYVRRRGGTPLVTVGDQMLAVVTKGSELGEVGPGRVAGTIHCRAGERALVAVIATDNEPLFVSEPDAVDARLDRSIRSWQEWSDLLPDDGPWAQAVRRSALALKTLLYEPGGAIAAAATTSLPERIGGEKNYDYRYSWIRDSSFVLDAFTNLGLNEEVHGAVSWLLSSLRRSAPELKVFYSLGGGEPEHEAELEAPGYRWSRPVRSGNSASGQRQLGLYGDLFDMIARYVDAGHVLDGPTGAMLATLADQCCDRWQSRDSGMWELADLQHYTISKIGCWVALDRACRLASQGDLPSRHRRRWLGEAAAIKQWVDVRCWSDEQQSYTFFAGSEKLDAAVLLAGRTGFERGPRLRSTIEAVVGRLGEGPMLYRYSGMREEEGAFLACSF